MPFRAETIRGYVQGIISSYLDYARATAGCRLADPVQIEMRFRYNQAFRSVVAIVPGSIMLLLILIPAMLTALAWCGRRSSARSPISTAPR